METTKKNLTVKELMEYMGVSRATAYELVNSEGFPAFKIGKKILVNVDLLKEWIRENVEKRWATE